VVGKWSEKAGGFWQKIEMSLSPALQGLWVASRPNCRLKGHYLSLKEHQGTGGKEGGGKTLQKKERGMKLENFFAVKKKKVKRGPYFWSGLPDEPCAGHVAWKGGDRRGGEEKSGVRRGGRGERSIRKWV